MIKKSPKILFVCANCGNEFLKWSGQCPACFEWNTLKEIKREFEKRKKATTPPAQIYRLKEIKADEGERIKTGFAEFDRVLGGGLVPGSVILLGGDPGIGKSTLLLQVIGHLSSLALYISGEESLSQIKLRSQRLKLNPSLEILAETNLEAILELLDGASYKVVVVDSIQTIYSPEYPSTAGSIVQVRESALKLIQFAKSQSVSLILVGHVTKEGGVAGPRLLEHAVDALIYLEGEKMLEARILRAVKNRFGAIDETGLFLFGKEGFKEVKEASLLYTSKHPLLPGSAKTLVVQGSKNILAEIQSLVAKTPIGFPKRSSVGVSFARFNLLTTVLSRRSHINLFDQDVLVSVVGGLRIEDASADLATALAIASSYVGVPLPEKLCFVGEVGLLGEIKLPPDFKKRQKEAEKLGFKLFSPPQLLNQAITSLLRKT